MAGRWVSVNEAAEALDTSTDAIRKRVQRESLKSKREDGRVLVWLDDGGMGESEALKTELVEVLRDEVTHLREQLAAERRANEENRRLLAAALERVPAIEAPDASPREQNPPDPGQRGASEGSSTPETGEANFEPRRGWLRRLIGR